MIDKVKLVEEHAETYTDIPDYSGYCPDCPQCGETMGYSYIKSEFKCKVCGYIMDEGDWDYESEADPDEIPFGCSTCGGPWPKCQIGCNMYED